MPDKNIKVKRMKSKKTNWTIFWEQRPYPPILMTMVADAVTKNFAKRWDVKITESANLWKDQKNTFLFKTDEVLEGGKILIDKLRSKTVMEDNIKNIYHFTDKLGKTSKEIVTTDLKKKSKEELIILYKKTVEAFNDFYPDAFVPIFVEYGKNLLSEMSEEIIRRNLRKIGQEDRFAEFYVPLLTPENPTIMIDEELELLEILRKINTKDLREISDDRLFKDHISRWNWLSFDLYKTIAWKEKEYLERVEDILKETDIEKRIKEIKGYSKNIKEKQENLEKELGLTGEDLWLIKATRRYGEVKEYRKNMILLCSYRIYILIKEVALRLDTDITDVLYLSTDEIYDIFKKFDPEIAKKRMKASAAISVDGKSRFIYEEEYDDYLATMHIRDEIDTRITEIKGTPACTGSAEGIVKIINNIKDAKKMQEGDILVSVATMPELVPAMKKAAAIITDDGGITCHAAIVSRELNIPCIIGTHIASKVLEDGERVRLDANQGTIIRSGFKAKKQEQLFNIKTGEEKRRYRWKTIAHDFNSHYFRNHIWTNAMILQSRIFNIPYWKLAIVSQNNNIKYVTDMVTWKKAAEAVKHTIDKDMYFIDKVIDTTSALGERFNRWSEHNIFDKDLSKLDNKEIIRLYKEFYQKQAEMYAHGVLLPLMDFGEFSFVENNLRGILKKRFPKERYDEFYSLFTSPIKNSFAQDQEEDLLELIEEYHEKAWFKDILNKTIEDICLTQPEFYEKLVEHTKKYCWVYFVYSGPAFTEKNFLDFIKDYMTKGIDPAVKFAQIKDEKKKRKEDRQKTIDDLDLTEFETMILNLAGKIVWAKPRRKDYQSRSYYHLLKLHKEIAKRMYLSLDQARSIPYEKLEGALERGFIDPNILNSINEFHVCTPSDDLSIEMLHGENAKDFFKDEVLDEESDIREDIKELDGTTACPGKTEGKVRIINSPADMEKMEYGDILVSIATTPSIIPAMKKAAAIVTEEGGLTCHASIVSRELGIPCIVGTKIATKVFKDDDLVEIDATKGIIKRIDTLKSAIRSQDTDKGAWMLAEDIPNLDLSFSQIWLSCFTNEFANPGGKAYDKVLAIYKDYHLWFYYDKNDSYEVGEHIVNKFLETPDFAKEVNENITYIADKLRTFAEDIDTNKLYSLTDKGLWEIYSRHDILHTQYYQWCWIPVAIDMFHNNFTDHLKSYLRKKETDEKKINEYFTLLTCPTKKSLIVKEHIGLLKIIANIQRIPEEKRLFKRYKKEIKEKTDRKIIRSIKKHHERYFYVKHMWLGEDGVYDLDHYIKEITRYISSGKDAKREIERKDKTFIETKKRREELIERLNLDDRYIKLFDAFGDFMVTKIYRRYSQIFALYKMHPVIAEIANRLQITEKQARFMLTREVRDALLEGKIDRDELAQRTVSCAYLNKNNFEEIYTGEKAKKLIKSAEEDSSLAEKGRSIEEFHGQTGCMGKAKGKVKTIIRPSDMHKMNKGDILVSIATDPDIVPAMKKAAAIVTDQGGVTSHAAIVARELGIPCIIGTKIATKVLQDDDYVEVDADKGVVKKISVKPKNDKRNKIRLIIFDAYGVTLEGGYPPTCQELGKIFDKDWKELIKVMYHDLFNKAAEGKITQQECWEQSIIRCNLPLTVEELKKIHYSFFKLNKEMIKFIRKLKKDIPDIQTLLLSKNTTEQFIDTENIVHFSRYFDEVINTIDLSLPKASKETMQYIFKRFDVRPEEIIYIDDQEENLHNARELGVNTIFYQEHNKFIKEFKDIIKPEKRMIKK